MHPGAPTLRRAEPCDNVAAPDIEEGSIVAKFLVKASYTVEGAKGVQSGGGTSRRDAVAKMVDGLGGKLESFSTPSAAPTCTP